ncbi:MAG: ATP-binding cassette domain-containing protein [Planctomycetota bacterium]|nr:ATP-binding cassette domain-containing protein [Planctomycetota bacterium]
MDNKKDTPLLQITDMTVALGDTVLLKGFEISLSKGECVAILGPSGSGKTTLLRTITGLIDAPRGNILYRGKPREEFTFPAFRRKAVLVEQQPSLFDMSVEKNLRKPFEYHSARNGGFDEERAKNLLKRVGLADRWNQNATSLSVGQQQRLALVRGLLVEPEMLLLDEPTSALDAAAVDMVEGMLCEEMRGIGCTALVVSHSEEQAERMCGRKIRLDEYMTGNGGDA